MAEHIYLPGFGRRVVVTRDFAYRWLKGCGYDPSDRGIGSLDYMVFWQPALAKPLTDLGAIAGFLDAVQDAMRRVNGKWVEVEA